ncbi:MAG: hypothetical protein OEL76_04905 [Siculibacillus sp.]|nr:hypothetical protein [Siculibacillus sp.]
MSFRSIRRKIRDALSDVVPNWMPFNYVFAVPKFHRANGRFPVGESSPEFEFNDFVFWRMIRNDRRMIEKVCTDKQFAKIYARSFPGVHVAETIDVFRLERGRTLGDFEAFLARHLGRRLVAKPTHSSGPILFLDQSPSAADVAKFFAASKVDFFRDKRETQYRGLEKKILIEENISVDGKLSDYKFYVVKGIPLYSSMVFDRFGDISCAVMDLNDLSVIETEFAKLKFPAHFEPPAALPEMIDAAGRLAAEFDFVRVDLYHVNGRVHFGEFTFSPSAGSDPMSNKVWTRRFARQILDILRER